MDGEPERKRRSLSNVTYQRDITAQEPGKPAGYSETKTCTSIWRICAWPGSYLLEFLEDPLLIRSCDTNSWIRDLHRQPHILRVIAIRQHTRHAERERIRA